MNRRESLKTLGLGTIGASLLLEACKTSNNSPVVQKEEFSFLPNLKTDLRNSDQKGRLIFTFTSLAYAVKKGVDKGPGKPPIEGMEKLADLAHK
ncbi:MAG: hypothetical protein ABI325_08520, partial [Ginsengibacter sp.]